jgi:hypothetical protein
MFSFVIDNVDPVRRPASAGVGGSEHVCSHLSPPLGHRLLLFASQQGRRTHRGMPGGPEDVRGDQSNHRSRF